MSVRVRIEIGYRKTIVQRVVIKASLPEEELIRAETARLGLPLVVGDESTPVQVGDMRIGITPSAGYDGLGRVCCEYYAFQADIAIMRLQTGQLVAHDAVLREPRKRR